MTRWLAVDTATEACSVALWQDGTILERFEVAGRSHTERLLPMLHALLADTACTPSQLDGFVCGVGPGSFAGVRIGVGFVKGMALALDRPIVPVLSLISLAQRVMRLNQATQVAAAIDARMNEVYFGAFSRNAEGRAEITNPAQVCAPASVPSLIGSWHAAGSGWKTYEPLLRKSLDCEIAGVDSTALPHAEDALIWAEAEWKAGRLVSADELEPVYLRDKVALTLREQISRVG